MTQYFKLRKKPSESTGFEFLYAQTLKSNNVTWNSKGKLFTKDKIITFIQEYYQSLPVGENLPIDWEIIEYEMILSSVQEPKSFVEKKNKIPLIKV